MDSDDSPYSTPAPDGYRWVWVPAREIPTERWEAVKPGDTKRCRRTDHGVRCSDPSVARLDRAQLRSTNPPPRWWHYCERHMFGRRIREGVIETCILAPDAPALSAAGLS